MSDPKTHYEKLLAQYYTWMFGVSFADKVAEQHALLQRILGPAPVPGGTRGAALDLGCGPGFQSLALAELGFAPVIALDTSAALLAELRAHAGGRPIRGHQADLLSLASHADAGSTAVITCMGDTLTHLADQQSVRSLFAQVAAALAPGGRLIVTYRDLSEELTGLDRFFDVRSDADTLMSCFVEYDTPGTVMVHDLVHVREEAHWRLRKSCYRKLRMSCAWVTQELVRAGLTVAPAGMAGRLVLLEARKP
jgi:SAM-dependent methyltransferase